MPKLSELFSAHDMTTGKPVVKILQFAVPLLVGNIAQQLYNTVDTIVVGKYVGDNALSSVGSSGPVLNLILVLLIGIATGTGIMVSQYYGAKQRHELSLTVGNCILLTAIASLVIMIGGPLITPPLMRLLNTPDNIFPMCCTYLTILFVGIAGCAYYNILSGILRGLGDSITALVVLLIATVINIGLDLLFVAVFEMGVMGVALATVIAQFISAALCFVRLMQMKHIIDFNRDYLKPHRHTAFRLIRLGLPSGLSQAIFAMSTIVVQSLTNSFGNVFIACCVIVMRVDGFAMMPNFTFNNAMITYTGQNIGAGKLDRVEKGAKQGTLLAISCAVVLTTCILVFGRQLMGMFTNTQELIDMSMQMMTIIAFGYIVFAINQCLCGVMSGAGDTVTPMIISFVTTVIVRVPIAYLLAHLTKSEEYPKGDPSCIFYSLLISWLVGTVLSITFYKLGRWRNKSIVAKSLTADSAPVA